MLNSRPRAEAPAPNTEAARRRRWGSYVGLALVVLGLMYASVQGTWGRGAKDIDTRYFFVAGKVWTSGQSPYDFATYQRVWREHFQDEVGQGAFSYLPGAIVYTAPLGLFDWTVSCTIFRLFNLGALITIVLCCLRYLRHFSDGSLRLMQLVWVGIALLIGGIPGTILTGQSTVLVCAAALVIIAPPTKSKVLLFMAMLVASSKPQVSGPVLVLAVVANRPWRRTLVQTASFAAGASVVILLLDPHPIINFLNGFTGNSQLPANQLDNMIGLGPLLHSLSIGGLVSRLLQTAALVAVLVLTARAWLSDPVHKETAATMVGFLSVGLAYPFHAYDTAIFAPACALASQLPPRRQLVLLPAFLLMGRPGMVERLVHLMGKPAMVNLALGSLWLGLVLTMVVWTSLGQAQPKAAPNT
jgi:hypothetical protein